jgi:hypothetical protein
MTQRQRISAGLAGAAVSLVCALGMSSTASAYPHAWQCTAAEYIQCYDNTGTQYNPWRGVVSDLGDNARPHVCAKGITANNNIRSGSGCTPNLAYSFRACFSGGTPDTWGYVYWGGNNTGPILIRGRARTERCPANIYD